MSNQKINYPDLPVVGPVGIHPNVRYWFRTRLSPEHAYRGVNDQGWLHVATGYYGWVFTDASTGGIHTVLYDGRWLLQTATKLSASRLMAEAHYRAGVDLDGYRSGIVVDKWPDFDPARGFYGWDENDQPRSAPDPAEVDLLRKFLVSGSGRAKKRPCASLLADGSPPLFNVEFTVRARNADDAWAKGLVALSRHFRAHQWIAQVEDELPRTLPQSALYDPAYVVPEFSLGVPCRVGYIEDVVEPILMREMLMEQMEFES